MTYICLYVKLIFTKIWATGRKDPKFLTIPALVKHGVRSGIQKPEWSLMVFLFLREFGQSP